MSDPIDLRSNRSVLMVPAHSRRYIKSARRSEAHVVAFDLEDGVPPGLKSEALSNVLSSCTPHDIVRVCSPRTSEFGQQMRDLNDLDFILMLPKVENADDVAGAIGFHRRNLIISVESPKGLKNLDSILDSGFPIVGVAFGRWDFQSNIGWAPAGLIRHAQYTIALSAHSRGIACWDAPSKDEWLSNECVDAVLAGMTGKGAISPRQSSYINRTYNEFATKAEMPFHWSTLTEDRGQCQ